EGARHRHPPGRTRPDHGLRRGGPHGGDGPRGHAGRRHLRRGHGQPVGARGVPRADGPATMSTTLPADGDAVLTLESVCSSYGPYRALFDVSFTVPHGAVVALVGSNGAGKSTVARTVTGLVTASAGRILLEQRDVTMLPAYKIARLGIAHVVEGR